MVAKQDFGQTVWPQSLRAIPYLHPGPSQTHSPLHSQRDSSQTRNYVHDLTLVMTPRRPSLLELSHLLRLHDPRAPAATTSLVPPQASHLASVSQPRWLGGNSRSSPCHCTRWPFSSQSVPSSSGGACWDAHSQTMPDPTLTTVLTTRYMCHDLLSDANPI